ncbi:MAG: hypothetical protein AAF939_14635 [Planctomycetota bacterium]
MLSLRLSSLSFIVISVFLVSDVHADLVTFESSNNNEFYSLNRATGDANFVNNINALVVGMAFDSSVNAVLGIANQGGADSLIGIDFATGTITSNVTFTGTEGGLNPDGLAYDPLSGTLFGIDSIDGQGNRALFTIDKNSGLTSRVNSSEQYLGNFNSLTIDRTTGTIFSLGRLQGQTAWQLFELNSSTGAATSVATIRNSGSFNSLAYDPLTNLLYSIDNSNGELISIDHNNGGLVNVVGTTSLSSTQSMVAAVPEPSSFLFFGCAFAGLLHRRIRG